MIGCWYCSNGHHEGKGESLGRRSEKVGVVNMGILKGIVVPAVLYMWSVDTKWKVEKSRCIENQVFKNEYVCEIVGQTRKYDREKYRCREHKQIYSRCEVLKLTLSMVLPQVMLRNENSTRAASHFLSLLYSYHTHSLTFIFTTPSTVLTTMATLSISFIDQPLLENIPFLAYFHICLPCHIQAFHCSQEVLMHPITCSTCHITFLSILSLRNFLQIHNCYIRISTFP